MFCRQHSLMAPRLWCVMAQGRTRFDAQKSITAVAVDKTTAIWSTVRTSALHTLMFSGQGTQHTGMACDLYSAHPAARRVLDTVNEELGFSLSELMFHGPAETLRLTSNAQPAIFAHSMAILQCLIDEGFIKGLQSVCVDATSLSSTCESGSDSNVRLLMGHSLGEFGAATAAGCFSLRHACRITRARGSIMQSMADDLGAGSTSMVALLGKWNSLEPANELCERACELFEEPDRGTRIVCEVANWNSTSQVVISGNKEAVDKAIDLGKSEYGVRRAMPLDVSAPFHCSLMERAEPTVRASIGEETLFRHMHAPIVMNFDGRIEEDGSRVREFLCKQTTATVKWTACMRAALDFTRGQDDSTFLEIGPGKVLKGLMMREVKGEPKTGKKPRVLSVSSAKELEELLLAEV